METLFHIDSPPPLAAYLLSRVAETNSDCFDKSQHERIFLGDLKSLSAGPERSKESGWVSQQTSASVDLGASLQFLSNPVFFRFAHVIPSDLIHFAVKLYVVSVRIEKIDGLIIPRTTLTQACYYCYASFL